MQITLAQAKEDGLHQTPVPSHIIFEFKYEDSVNTKPKARWVLAGTPKNMRAQEHFFECFAHAPDPDSTRFLQALAVGRGLSRAKADVHTALLNSIVPNQKWVPVITPAGMETCRYMCGCILSSESRREILINLALHVPVHVKYP